MTNVSKKQTSFSHMLCASVQMTDEDEVRSTKIENILSAALRLPQGGREAYLASACGENHDLLEELRSYLAAHRDMGDFLECSILPVNETAEFTSEEGVIPGYAIQGEIGRGGMGKVFRAARTDGIYQKEVAIKILRQGFTGDESGHRFRHERQFLARLDHPYIVRILDGGTTQDGRPYFVMEQIEGVPIDRHCSNRELPVRARLELFLKVCSAVAFAHQKLVVHRDLKPPNILIDQRGEPKLLDFGIAKLLEPGQEPLTLVGTQPMTPRYASPEQIENGAITTATDVYSLGQILYEILTGASLHGDSSPGETLRRRILETDPLPPSREPRCGHLAGDLDSIVLKALEKDPRRRYASVEQLAADVRRQLDGQPVRARQGTAVYRMEKFVRRNWLGVAILLSVLLAGLIFGLTMKSLRDQAVQERQRAENVADLLVEVFQHSNPEVAKGEDVTARRLLDEYAETIDGELVDDAATRADLMSAMGKAYLGLAIYDRAEFLLEKSLVIRREDPDTKPQDLIANLYNLADIYRKTDRLEEALELSREALDISYRDADAASLAPGLNNLALLLKQSGHLAPNQHNLATVLREQGNYEEAEDLYRKALELKRIQRGEDSAEVATTLKALALLHLDRGTPEAAEPLLQRALRIREGIYTRPSHPKIAAVLVDLGRVAQGLGRRAEAAARYNEAMQIYTVIEEESSDVAQVLQHQASLLLAQGDIETAETTARRALGVFQKTKPAGHWQIAEAESLLGACLFARGRLQEAAPLVRRGYETLKEVRGERAWQTREARERLERLALQIGS